LASFAVAAFGALGMAKLLEGPRLGPYYDFLVRRRPPPELSAEITLIETGGDRGNGRGEFFRNFIEAETAASVLMILAEFDASGLVLQVPLLGIPGPGRDEAELTDRFEEEFGLLEGNIRNLFEAIRLGSIHPASAEGYVGELIRLTEGGKERLLAALFRDAEGRVFDRASAAFGRNRIALAVSERGGEAGVRPDPDGVLRRIRPLVRKPGGGEGGEHPVYTLIREACEEAAFEEAPGGPVLRLVKPGAEDLIVPLDSEGAVLVEGPGRDQDFRRLSLGAFSRYEAADRDLYQALSAAASLGIYGELNPELYPPILYEYALSLREELLRSPAPDRGGEQERKSRWREGRAAYFAALEELCYGPWEMRLISAYEERGGAGDLEPEEIRRLQDLRDEVSRTFVGIRDKYRVFMEIKELLRSSLASSLCILGPRSEAAPGAPDIEASGMLASSLLTGTVIRPGGRGMILLCSLGVALVTCLALLPLGPLPALGAGFFLTALSWGGFSWSFVLGSCWIDPLIPSSAALGGTLASSLFTAFLGLRARARIRRAYGAVLPPSSLKILLRSGTVPSPEPLTDYAVIAAVRNGAMMNREDPREIARDAAAFREEILRWCQEAGAVMAGWEGDAALIAFGSPLERGLLPPAGGDRGLIPRALGLVRAAANGGDGSWYFGIDAGPCSFAYTPDAGYRVYGAPAIRSRVLSVLAFRCQARVLVTAPVKEDAALIPSRRLKIPLGREGAEIFYALAGGALSEGCFEDVVPADVDEVVFGGEDKRVRHNKPPPS
jgi:hypothetical protein